VCDDYIRDLVNLNRTTEKVTASVALVIPHPEAAKLTEPGKGALDDPPPPAQATPMRGAAHGQEGHDVTNTESATNRRPS